MRQRGSIILEFAITLPILLVLILGGIDLSLAAGAKNGLASIASETANCVARNPACPAPMAYAQQLATGAGMNPSKISNVAPGPPCGVTCVSYSVTYTTVPIGPFFKPITMTAVGYATK